MHPNTGPFIGKQLIQRLVTGNPSPAYVARIAAVFNNNGPGVRGDLKAVVRAILLDPEARGAAKTAADFGKLREPVLMVTGAPARAERRHRRRRASAAQTGNLGQRPYYSPTVFNYFPPDATIPGTSILAPGIRASTRRNSAVGRANLVYTLVYQRVSRRTRRSRRDRHAAVPAQFEPLATDPAAMVDAGQPRCWPAASSRRRWSRRS